MAPEPADPFAASTTRLAQAAARLGFSEGQAWSLGLGTVLVALLLAAALPDVAWRPTQSAAEVASTPPPSAPPPPRSSGLAPPIAVPVTITRPSQAPTAPAAPRPTEATTAPPATTTPTTTTPVAPTPEALHVVDGGYASSAPGTPLATASVPEGALAVALRAGQPDKIAFVRLGGTTDVLELALDRTPGANVLEPFAALLLCPTVEDGWQVGDGDTALDDAPPYDCSQAVRGTRNDTGDGWTFDLAAVADPTSANGFAIVPDGAGTPSTFQVVLSPTPPEEGP